MKPAHRIRLVSTRITLGLSLGIALGIVMATNPSLPAASAAEPVVGKSHPPLRLPTIDWAQTIDLRSLAGKKVLLIQFASW